MEPKNYFTFISNNFFKVTTILLIIGMFLLILSPFIIPIVLGGILAMALSPAVHFLMSYKWSRKKSINILTLIIFIIGLIPSLIFFSKGATAMREIINQQNLLTDLMLIKDNTLAYIDNHALNLGFNTTTIHEHLETVLKMSADFFFGLITRFISQIPGLMFTSFITFLSIYFFLLEEELIRKKFDQYFNLKPENANRFIMILKSSSQEVFFANVVTGIIQASIVSISASLLGVGDFFVVFFITFLFSFVPVLGAGPIAFIIALTAFMKGMNGAGIGMLVISGIAGVTDNLIRPYLASMGIIEVNGFINFLAVIGGVIIFGLPGLFLGPLLATLFFGALPVIFEDYR